MRKGLWLGVLVALVAVGALAAGTVYTPFTALKIGGGYGGSGVGGDAAGATIDANGDISTNGNATVGGTVSGARVNTTGGVHVGGTSDPGTDNLIVDGTSNFSGLTTVSANTMLRSGNGIGLRVGADSAAYTVTDATNKYFRIGVNHYTNAEEPSALIYAINDNSNNTIYIGGASSVMNSATEIDVYTAANNTTTSGTLRTRVDSAGKFTAYYDATVAGILRLGSGPVAVNNSTGNLLWAAMETPTVKETLILTGAGGEPTVTAGCYRTPLLETPTNKRCYRALKFDDATDESACWNVTTSPENCPTGATFTVKVRWKAARTGNVCFAVSSVATGHDDPYDAAKGTAVTGTVAVTSVGDEIVSSLGTMTPGGSFQAGDSLYVEVMRDANNVADTVADAVEGDESGDVEILGLSLDYVGRVN